jgi:ribosomal protein S18 acetylase RimI-like enzyme
VLFDRCEWQQGFQRWYIADELIGAVFFESDRDGVLIGHPDHPELIDPMLDWLEARYQAKGSPEPLMIEAMESNTLLCDRMKSRGYSLFPGYFIHRHKPLDPKIVEPVDLPAGFTIKPMETDDERRRYPIAVQSVFHRSATIEQDEFLKQAPSYMPELNLLVLSNQYEIAAFCSVWIDPANHYAEFEPVGTVPSFQKRGLGSALLAYAHNRLRDKNCPLATVQSWNESIGANKLYQAAGLLPKDNQLNWIKH